MFSHASAQDVLAALMIGYFLGVISLSLALGMVRHARSSHRAPRERTWTMIEPGQIDKDMNKTIFTDPKDKGHWADQYNQDK